MKAVALVTLLLLHGIVVALSISVIPPMISDRRVPMHCGIYENRELLSVVERICEMCHETYYEVYPRMGSDCRSQCYGSEQFKMCFNLFRMSSRKRMRDGQ